MDEYLKYGINHFYIRMNYKTKMIKAYFEENEEDYKTSYMSKEQPLGVAELLNFWKTKSIPHFLSPIAIIIKEEYNKIYYFHINATYYHTHIVFMKLILEGGLKKLLKS